MLAYFKRHANVRSQFPQLQTPCVAFAKFGSFANNANHAPGTHLLSYRKRAGGLSLVT